MQLSELENRLGYKFKNINLLKEALTHSSYANEHKTNSYERLEFLGDSIVGMICTRYLYDNFPEMPEGGLTKMRSSLVCEQSLSNFSKEIGIGDFMFLSFGEKRSGGANRASILCDMFESVTASIFLDSGDFEIVKTFVLKYIVSSIKSLNKRKFKDYKTQLQEIIQQNPEEKLTYAVVSATGPDHCKHFQVEVRVNSNCIGKGGGKSKKEAEQQAARVALELMGY